MKIPSEHFCDYLKRNLSVCFNNEEKLNEHHKWQQEQFELMKNFTWEDFETLTGEELDRVPISWLYDWAHVTSSFEYQSKIEELYKKHNIKILSPKEYLEKFDTIRHYDDVHKILPHAELRSYINEFLIDNREFISDVDACMWDNNNEYNLINKTIPERIEYFNANIGNTAKTYIFKILTLKHLSKILLNNIDGFTDEFWKNRLNNVLNKENLHKEYYNQLKKMLAGKFPDKTIEEISQMPLETMLENRTNEKFELSKNNVTDIITKKHNENKQKKKQEQIKAYNKPTSEEKLQRINELISQGKISISTLQRLFYISFPKAASIIDKLVENEIIEKLEKGYNILDKDKLKEILTNAFID